MNEMKHIAQAAEPSAGHLFLKNLSKLSSCRIITQNIDGMEKRAGCQRVIYLHGSLDEEVCNVCGHIAKCDKVFKLKPPTLCPNCCLIQSARERTYLVGKMVPNVLLENDGGFNFVD